MERENKILIDPDKSELSEQERAQIQQRNRAWWEKNPMRYDWNDKLGLPEHSPEYFREIDRRFFSDAARYTPPRTRPFDELVPYEKLPDWDVLEIGVGSGSHAQLLTPHCKTYTGIDLTEYAVSSTQKRFTTFELRGSIVRMDAEQLSFPDRSFDFVWTWGVIHHSSNTARVLSEIYRVLRPGGSAVIMVYHRSFLHHYVFTGLFRGVFGGGLFRANSLDELVQLSTDGAIARFYKRSEWVRLAESKGFSVEGVKIKGQKSEVVPLPPSRVKDTVVALLPNAFSRFLLNTCKQGSFLITTLRKL